MRWIVLIALAACTESHDPTAMELGRTDCETCHKPESDPTSRLPHPNSTFPITNPNPLDVTSMHDGIACADCHHFDRGAGLEGVHADCTKTCHVRADIDGTHTGRASYAWDAMNHDFCLSCHPQGLKDALP